MALDIDTHADWCLSLDDDGMMPCDCGTADAARRREGAERERAKIVAWLREHGGDYFDGWFNGNDLADAIDAGKHHEH